MGKGAFQRPKKKDAENSRVRGTPAAETEEPALSHSQASIRTWLKQVRFRKAVIGGVDEADVWKKIAELNAMYEAALEAERTRYDALLKERVQVLARELVKQYRQPSAPAEQEKGADDSFG